MNRAQLSGLAMAALIRQPEFSLGFAIPANATDADRKLSSLNESQSRAPLRFRRCAADRRHVALLRS